MNNHSNHSEARNRFRIIGGNWRSRKLSFPGDVDSLRPTPDRIRETLFNWLQMKVIGARCLDLFSGSGALAFEALSRGAATVTAIDNSASVITTLRNNCQLLDCNKMTLVTANALQWLEQESGNEQYDIIFLDPPYSLELLPACLTLIDTGAFAADDCMVYLEDDKALENIKLPSKWQLTRSKKAGQVFYGVCTRRIN